MHALAPGAGGPRRQADRQPRRPTTSTCAARATRAASRGRTSSSPCRCSRTRCRCDPQFALAHAAIANVVRAVQLALRARRRPGSSGPRPRASRRAPSAATRRNPGGGGLDPLRRGEVRRGDRARRARRSSASRDAEGAYYLLGRALFAAGKYQEVADIAEAAVAASGEDYNVYVPDHQRARGARQEGGAPQRVRQRRSRSSRRTCKKVPEDARARTLLATDYAARSDRVEDAVREANLAMALRPNDAMVHLQRGLRLRPAGQEGGGPRGPPQGLGGRLQGRDLGAPRPRPRAPPRRPGVREAVPGRGGRSEPEGEQPMIGQTVSHYRVTAKLGSGGMGVVYEAEDTKLGRHVALKFLPAEMAQDAASLERFQREARAASALNHPGICTVHEIDQHEGQHFIAMELLEGETLAERIRKRALRGRAAPRPRDPDRGRARVGAREGDRPPRPQAGEHLRQRARPGQDPGLRPREDRAGAAGRAAASTPRRPPRCSRTSSPPRARRWARSPTCRPSRRAGQLTDARTDLFSLGTVLYQMATGALPFQGETSAVVFDAILNREPLPLSPGEPGAARRARPHPRQGAREGPQPPLPDRHRPQDRPDAAQARHRLRRPARGGARATRGPAPREGRPRSRSPCSTSRTSPA